MRSKLPTVAIGRYDAVTFDLIRSGLSRTTFPWSGRLWQMETVSPYRYRASWACRRKVSSRTGSKWGFFYPDIEKASELSFGGFCVGNTYLPGKSPCKYCRRR